MENDDERRRRNDEIRRRNDEIFFALFLEANLVFLWMNDGSKLLDSLWMIKHVYWLCLGYDKRRSLQQLSLYYKLLSFAIHCTRKAALVLLSNQRHQPTVKQRTTRTVFTGVVWFLSSWHYTRTTWRTWRTQGIVLRSLFSIRR
jgi:hypothetical protein